MPHYLRTSYAGRPATVDREHNVIRGYVVAQEGPFKDLRGEFNRESLDTIVKAMKVNPEGTKSRFSHPGLSDDGIGKFLGRAKDPRIDQVTVNRDGKSVTLAAVRADLHLAASAFKTPNGDLGGYVLDLAEEDSDAFSSSVVIEPKQIKRLGSDGRPLTGENGEPLPPLWMAERIHASDIVDTGDAVDGFLSTHGLTIDGLPDETVRRAWTMFDQLMAGKTRDEAVKLLEEQSAKYLAYRYGDEQRRLSPAVLRARIRYRDAGAAKK